MAKSRQKSKSKVKSKSNSNPQAWIIAAIVVLVGFAGFWFLRSTQIVPDQTLPAEISVEQAYREYQDGVYFLDVRTPEEWKDHHVPGTTLIPLDELPARISEIPSDQQVVVVCRFGNRSMQAREFLIQAGYSEVSSLNGGLNAWGQAGYELVSGEE
ncbi:MAG: rhodanese-like domain-containing protein [Anaerolineales bacterium]|nr:rhodanese-like domain-containing protein [Anaerolineales bacterium]